MPLEPILREIALRFGRVRCGLDVGFRDESVSRVLREFRGGVWRSIDADAEFPFEDRQFEVVVMAASAVRREVVREANRVLLPEGFLFFSVPESAGGQRGFTMPELYKTIREGFDILSVRRPKWWFFRRKGRTLTVCARKKAWREHKSFIREGGLPFTPFRKRK